ncbi:MAG: HD domain-containing protein [Rhodospirillales bacterium]|nr:HD domain-containing protein [Rhodospirillales bacterium]
MPDQVLPDDQTVSFIRMEDGTKEDYKLLGEREHDLIKKLPEFILAQMKTLAMPGSGYKIDRYQHSLQTATRAFRDEADEETVIAALLHDIGDTLAPENHSQLAASLLRPYVSDKTYWVVQHHGIFQGYYYFHHIGQDPNQRDRFRGHPYFEDCVRFCERWDQTAFDPDYDTMPMEAFEPMLRRVLARAPFRQV